MKFKINLFKKLEYQFYDDDLKELLRQKGNDKSFELGKKFRF